MTTRNALPGIPQAQPRSHRRKKEVIKAAAHVFREKGFHGASTKDITDILGIQQASLYYYFDSKVAVLNKICRCGIEGQIEAAETVMRRDGTPQKKIEQLVAAYLTALIQDEAGPRPNCDAGPMSA